MQTLAQQTSKYWPRNQAREFAELLFLVSWPLLTNKIRHLTRAACSRVFGLISRRRQLFCTCAQLCTVGVSLDLWGYAYSYNSIAFIFIHKSMTIIILKRESYVWLREVCGTINTYRETHHTQKRPLCKKLWCPTVVVYPAATHKNCVEMMIH